jgi:branched-chain amino acid aminotransferase
MRYTFLNGRLLPLAEAGLALNDIGVLRGYGVCDVLRTENRRPFLIDKHVERLRRSGERLGLVIPYFNDAIKDQITELIRRNTSGEAGIKLILTGGPSVDGVSFDPATPTFYILVDEFKPLPEAYFRQGVTLATHEHQRALPESKTLNYLTMVHNHPKRTAAGAFELLYYARGELREAATSNVFLVKGNILFTPATGILPGITRATILELAQAEMAVEVRTIPMDELREADEVFLTATNKDVLPVVAIDGHPVGNGHTGPVSQRLLERFRDFRRSVTAYV